MNRERFARIFNVLEILAREPNGLRLTELSEALGAPVSSTHNLLRTMVESDVLCVDEDLRYSLGPRAIRAGVRIMNSLDVRTAGRRHLERLAKNLANDVYLAVRVGQQVVYVDRFRFSEPVSVNIRIGDALALHATAVGKLFAAFEPDLQHRVLHHSRRSLTSATITDAAELGRELERIRATGVSVSREEAHEGIVGIAVPIRDASGQLVAAIHVSALRAGLSEEREGTFIEKSRQAAAAIGTELGVLDSTA